MQSPAITSSRIVGARPRGWRGELHPPRASAALRALAGALATAAVLVAVAPGSGVAQATGDGSESEWRPILTRSSDGRVLRKLPPPPRGTAGMRLVISISDRTLAAIHGRDTVLFAPVGVATGMTLSYAGRKWSFETPRGGRRVLRKLADPVWTPPDWHYAEVAREHGLKLSHIPAGGVRLDGGRRLVVKRQRVGLIMPRRGFVPLPLEEHVVFGDRLYVPPLGSHNRKITRELGDFALDLGGGYLIHGTPEEATVGQASTHGCLRMRDIDLVWLFENVPVGAPVTIH